MSAEVRALEEAAAPTTAPGLTVLRGTPQDDAARDRFVRTHPEATFFHLSGWRRAMEHLYGHEPLELVARRGGERALEQRVGVAPVARAHMRGHAGCGQQRDRGDGDRGAQAAGRGVDQGRAPDPSRDAFGRGLDIGKADRRALLAARRHPPRLASSSHASSVSVVTPSCSALRAFEPASAPTTT